MELVQLLVQKAARDPEVRGQVSCLREELGKAGQLKLCDGGAIVAGRASSTGTPLLFLCVRTFCEVYIHSDTLLARRGMRRTPRAPSRRQNI